MSHYFNVTDEMRKTGLFGPYLDRVGPYPTKEIAKEQELKVRYAAVLLKEWEENHKDWWGEDPNHSVDDWAIEVANDDTRLGYWDWVRMRKDDPDFNDEVEEEEEE